MEDRVILVDKPEKNSSFGAVSRVRRKLTEKFGHKVKVGHTGTLDPFATGLLVLLSGKMTKKSGEFLKLDKVYEATMKLGFISSTGDVEGDLMKFESEDASRVPTLGEVESALKHFERKIQQRVPIYSAVKINGQRAYKLARKGKEVEMPVREIEVYEIELLKYDYPFVKFRCHVSSGIYVRTLAEDIGRYMKVGAYLTELRRVKVGKYDVKDAVKLDDFEA